jgi:hypothetical protein
MRVYEIVSIHVEICFCLILAEAQKEVRSASFLQARQAPAFPSGVGAAPAFARSIYGMALLVCRERGVVWTVAISSVQPYVCLVSCCL